MPRDESAYLLDILIAANRARRYVRVLTFADFVQSSLHRHAVLMAITSVGEAASRVSLDTKLDHPEIPWTQMTAIRNRIVHRYFRIDFDVIWTVVQEDLPKLIVQLAPLVPSEAD